MPSSPGSRPVIMQLQAGTVIGGSTLRSGPHVPPSHQRVAGSGSSSRQRSNTSFGSAQSRPMTATRPLTWRPAAAPSDHSPAGGEGDGVRPGPAVELDEQVVDDVLDGPLGVVQALGDPARALPVGEQPQHLVFAL